MIIFTTNLPNVNDLDEALLRPGRCFANVRTRGLTHAEAVRLMQRTLADRNKCDAALDKVFPAGVERATVAEIYRAAGTAITPNFD